jgi:prepilin-type N-terminal cleavage/methylation domain-containing protein
VQPSVKTEHLERVKHLRNHWSRNHPAAFTLIEMLVVITILSILMGAGISLLGGTGMQSRKAGADMISGMVDQARTLAITNRADVFLVIAEPGTLPGQDERCRLGLLREVPAPPGSSGSSPPAKTYELLRRWQTLNTGVVLIGGTVDGVPNPVDVGKVKMTIRQGNGQITADVYQISVNSMGSLALPKGSTPIVLRLAEGAYRSGKPSTNKVEGGSGIAETQLKIGRVMARPYRSN